MMTPLVLHIGSHKTGSTFLQNWLRKNSRHLRNSGILTPETIMHNHRIASEIAARNPKLETLHTRKAMTIGLEEVLRQVCENKPDNYKHSVISSEFFFRMNPKLVYEVLSELGFEIKTIVCFLRRQDRLLASSYAQEIKIGKRTDNFELKIERGPDWFEKFSRWSRIFPDADLEFFDYEHEKNTGNFLNSFRSAIGCPAQLENEVLPLVTQSNPSYDARILEILRESNAHGFETFGRLVIPFTEYLKDGPAFGLDDQDTAKLESMYREANEKFQKAYGRRSFPSLCERQWKPTGVNLFGNFPEARMMELLYFMQRMMVLCGVLPLGSNGSTVPKEGFKLLNTIAKQQYSRDITRLVENAAHHATDVTDLKGEASAEDFPKAVALYVLEYACKQMEVAGNPTSHSPHMTKQKFYNEQLQTAISRPSLKDLSLPQKLGFAAQLIWDSAGFDPDYYVACNPDVLVQKVDPYEHFYRYGRNTKKICRPPYRFLQGTSLRWKPGETNIMGKFSEFDRNRETVLIVLHEGSRTGAPIIGYNLLLHMVKKYNVICLILAPGPIARACRDAGAVVIQAKNRANDWAAGAYLVRQICEQEKLKFAIVNSALSRFVLGGLVMHEVPRVTLVHEAATEHMSKHELPYLLTLSNEVVVPSDYVLNSIYDGCPQHIGGNYPVHPQGICKLPTDSHASRPETETEVKNRLGLADKADDTVLVAGIGTVDYRKGVDLFIQTACQLLRVLPGKNLHFAWIGTGYEPELRGDYPSFIADQLKKSGIAERITMAGGLNNMSEVYANIDILLLTSRMDPMPNVAIEAMEKQVPVICFEKCTGTSTFLAKHGLRDLCVADYLDPHDMAGKAAKLIEDGKSVEMAKRYAKDAVHKELVIDEYCEKIEAIACSHSSR